PELPGGLPGAARAFEDRFAPDAFGVQLLGPGYEGRVPPTPLYRAEPAGAGCTLLEHADLPAWLDEPFGPEVPPVLAEAREALAPILFGPELL
ncbi:MAG: hypothetical protein M3389_09020, partial [Actinomycetota bacterium]|nr:hypothetical protein [Actinomycetota bacterium]